MQDKPLVWLLHFTFLIICWLLFWCLLLLWLPHDFLLLSYLFFLYVCRVGRILLLDIDVKPALNVYACCLVLWTDSPENGLNNDDTNKTLSCVLMHPPNTHLVWDVGRPDVAQLQLCVRMQADSVALFTLYWPIIAGFDTTIPWLVCFPILLCNMRKNNTNLTTR